MKKTVLTLAIVALANITYAQFSTSGNPTTTMDNVGIGTTIPTSKLEVRSDGSGMNWTGKLAFSNAISDRQVFLGTYNGNSVVASHNFALNAWKPLYLNTVDGATGMVIQGNGAIGVNTNSPQAILHVAGASNNIGVGVQDGNDRPGLSVSGNYPQLVLMSGIANVNHGSSISLGAFDSGSSGAFKSWTLGTPGNNATFMDIGYGTSTNPHFNGLAGFGTTVMRFTNEGNVGIGTTNPVHKLHVNGTSRLGGGDYGNATVLSIAPGTIGFDAPGISGGRFYISGSNGNIGIGTNTPDAKLAVNGTIHSKEVKVDLTGWPDYVFKPNYKLPALKYIKTYIDKYQHLPEMPSEAEVNKNGINLGEINKLLVKKVEELTLYQIKQYEKSKQQEARIAKLEKALSKLSEKKR